MPILTYASKPVEEVLSEFQTDRLRGLAGHEAVARLARYGKNEITGESLVWWHILLRQFRSPFIYLLVAAAVLALVLGETIDGAMVVFFVLVNVIIGFYQEYRSEQTLKLLKQYVVSAVKVRRQGTETVIASRDLVPGDIITLVTGDRIQADVRFFETANLTVDESILTGESVPAGKDHAKIGREIKGLHEAANLGFCGTTVVRGKASGIVVATGRRTVVGEIGRLASETRHVSGFEKGISRFSKFIIRLVLSTLIFIYFANLFLKGGETDTITLLIFSIALAVSVIPEALPLVITFSLSRGALRLAKKKVVVRRLSAIEDLGGIDVLCTDKTGTLTENSLTIKDVRARDGRKTLVLAALVASSGRGASISSEPFDAALFKSLSGEEKKNCRKSERLDEIPFDPSRRRNAVLLKNGDGLLFIVRGAPEEILPLCRPLAPSEKSELNVWITQAGREGQRVLAIASARPKTYSVGKLGDLERDLEWGGAVSFIDPIKPSTMAAITQARALGVNIKIITGDSREVAGAVAFKVGLVSAADEAITGAELEALREDEQTKAVEKYIVFARVSPEQKYKIIELLEREHEVGFLGEGINDTPALKIANVSLVVQSAADVAREAADIVLLQKNLKVIIDGIKDGREVFANTSKYIKITLASNFGNFYAVAIASLLIPFLPMLPVQILLVNLLSDFPMIAIAADTVDKADLAKPQKYNIKDIIIIATILGVVSSVFDFILFGMFFRISPETLQTNWFIGSILTELALIYSLRTKLPFFRAKFPSRGMLALSILAAAATLILPFSALGRDIFHFSAPTPNFLFLILSVVVSYFIITEIVKLFYYRSSGANQDG